MANLSIAQPSMVFAMSKRNMNASIPTIFRSYRAPANQSSDCSIWEALCASMAHPDLFKSVEIGESPMRQSFVDGGLGCNNPLVHVLNEVKMLHPGRHVASILSVGTGHTRTIEIPEPNLLELVLPTSAIIAMKNIATDSERVAQEMETRFHGTGVYFRFNVDQGLQNVGLTDWERLSDIFAHTQAYTQLVDVKRRMGMVAQAIRERKPTVSTARIGTNNQICVPILSLFTSHSQMVRYRNWMSILSSNDAPRRLPYSPAGKPKFGRSRGACSAKHAHENAEYASFMGSGEQEKPSLRLKS